MKILIAALVSPMLALGVAATALGVSPSQEECEASGGTFTRVNGEVQCVENVGNSENSATTTSTGQGNSNNKESCIGPGQSTAHCD